MFQNNISKIFDHRPLLFISGLKILIMHKGGNEQFLVR